MSIYVYILAEKSAFGGLHCYGASSTAALRRRSDDCASMTEPWWHHNGACRLLAKECARRARGSLLSLCWASSWRRVRFAAGAWAEIPLRDKDLCGQSIVLLQSTVLREMIDVTTDYHNITSHSTIKPQSTGPLLVVAGSQPGRCRFIRKTMAGIIARINSLCGWNSIIERESWIPFDFGCELYDISDTICPFSLAIICLRIVRTTNSF